MMYHKPTRGWCWEVFFCFLSDVVKKKCTRVERSWVSIIDKQIELNDLRPVTWKYPR